MKKNIIYIAALALIATACTNDSLVTVPTNNGTSEGKMITETITATNGDAPTRAAIADADGAFTWSAGDQVAVHADGKYYTTEALTANSSDENATFTVTYSGTRDAFAIFPASIVATDAENYGQSGKTLDVTLPGSYTLAQVSGTKTPCPMIATNTGGDWYFKQLCGMLRLTVNSIPSDAIGMVIQFPGKKVNGTFSVASPVTVGTSTIVTDVPADGEDKITVTFAAGTTTATVNIPLPTGAYDDVFITPIGSSSKVAAVRHIKAGGYSAKRAYARKLTTTMVAFSVSASKKVVFAPGNLQASTTDKGANWTWKFAAHQYDFIGNAASNNAVNGNGTVSTNGTVDLFGFSTDVNKPNYYYGIRYSTTSSDYSGNFVDWGENIIGGYTANYWRTLSRAEWQYVVGEDTYRTNGGTVAGVSNALCTKATVNSKIGFILFPDNFSGGPTDIEWVTNAIGHGGMSNSGTTGWGTTISLAKWEQLEAEGCVFLPAAMVRFDNRMIYYTGCSFGGDYANDKGFYSSSTIRDANTIYTLRFANIGYDPDEYFNKAYGYSVRLVHEL